MRKSGIYIIENLITKDTYVGSSRDVLHRKSQHFSELKRQCHENKRVQKAYNQYGENSFIFAVLENVDNKDMLVEREQYWIDTLRPTYNILSTATNNSITRTRALEEKYKRHAEIMRGRKQSQETKDKRAASIKRYWDTHPPKTIPQEMRNHLSKINTGKNNPSWGLKRSKETVKKLSDGNARITRVGFVSPDGVEFRQVKNLGWFCREHELNYFSMRDVDSGRRKSHKGWTKVQT